MTISVFAFHCAMARRHYQKTYAGEEMKSQVIMNYNASTAKKIIIIIFVLIIAIKKKQNLFSNLNQA